MDLLQHVRHWLQDRVPLSKPKMLSLQVDQVIDDFGLTAPPRRLQIPYLDALELTGDLARLSVPEQSGDLALSAGSIELHDIEVLKIGLTDNFAVDFTELIGRPAILNLFTGLTLPGYAGKAYDGDGKSEPPELQDTGQLDMSTCPHGLPRYSCDVCNRDEKSDERLPRTRRRSQKHRVPTLDVFDLLLPFLQPPIESLLSQPLLFPEGRRPYDYQVQGIKFLAEHPSALLADEMGLGKTIQAIVALQVLFRRGEIFRVLILCRTSLLGTWEHELRKWAPEFHVLKVRGNRTERKWLWRAPASIYITTYATARQDVFRDGGSILPKFDLVVLDEVQDIKNPSTKQTRAVRQTPADYRWGLSGTPVENKPEDVISIFDYLRPRLFSSTSVYTPSQVKQKIQPYFLRRRAADVLDDLPDKIRHEVWLDLDPRQQESYDRVFEEGRQRLSQADATRTHALSIITKLQQICNQDPRTGKSCKLDYLIDQLDAVVENDQKALVYSRLPNVTLKRIMPELLRYKPALFHGGLRDSQREQLIQRFQKDGPPYIMLVSLQAGGVGLNLQRANHIFHFDHWWNPAVTQQAEARAHRIGQTRDVFVHDLYTKDTIEERVHQITLRKQEMFKLIVDDLSEEYVRSTFTDEELFSLFDLKPPSSTKSHARAPVDAAVDADQSAKAPSQPSVSMPSPSRSQPESTFGSADAMRNDVRRTLVQIVRGDGEIIGNPKRLVNLLRDLCPECKSDINLLELSLLERVPHVISRNKATQPTELMKTALAYRLVSNWGVERHHADWAVDVWIECLVAR